MKSRSGSWYQSGARGGPGAAAGTDGDGASVRGRSSVNGLQPVDVSAPDYGEREDEASTDAHGPGS